MCRDVRVREIESFMRYFLSIMGILRFCDFVIFLNLRNTLIFQSCSVKPPTRHPVSSEGVTFFFPFFPVYNKLINFKLVHSYNVKHLTCTIFYSNGLQNIFKTHKWEYSTYTKTLHLFTNNKKFIIYTK